MKESDITIQQRTNQQRKTLPVPFDSPRSHAAVETATDLAVRLGSDIQLLHVVQPPAYGYGGFAARGSLQVNADSMMRREAVARDLTGALPVGVRPESMRVEERGRFEAASDPGEVEMKQAPTRIMMLPKRSNTRWRRVSTACLALGSVCILLVACDGGGMDESRDVSASEAKREAREAMEAGEDYLAAERREWAQRAEAAASEAKQEAIEVQRELAELPRETREDLERALERFESAQEGLDRELDDMQRAGADQWAEAKRKMSNALEEMAEARREIMDALSGDEA